MAGLGPAIHEFAKTWMPGTRPGMTLPLLLSRSLRVLAEPALGAGMERHVDRRLLGIAPELRDALVVFLERHLELARGDRAADVVNRLFVQIGAAIDRPAAEIDAVVILLHAHLAGRDRLRQPRLDAFVENHVDLTLGHRIEAAHIARSAAEHELATPAFDIFQR